MTRSAVRSIVLPSLYILMLILSLSPLIVSSNEHLFALFASPAKPEHLHRRRDLTPEAAIVTPAPTPTESESSPPLPTDFSSAASHLASLQANLPTPFIDALTSLGNYGPAGCVESAIASLDAGDTPAQLYNVLQTVSVDRSVIHQINHLISVVELQTGVEVPTDVSGGAGRGGLTMVVPGMTLTTTSVTTVTKAVATATVTAKGGAGKTVHGGAVGFAVGVAAVVGGLLAL